MNVDEYLHPTGLNRQHWQDPQLRVLVQLLLNIQKPATGPAERFLSGTVIMDDGSGSGSTGIVREVAVELLEAAVSGRIRALVLSSSHPDEL